MGDDFVINIDVIDAPVQATFNRLIDLSQDLSTPFDEIAQHLKAAHRYDWEMEQEADGSDWEQLAPATFERKQKKGKPNAILREDGDLLRDLVTQSSSQSLEIGVVDKKAIYHQYGTKKMVARELLGVSEADILY